MRFVRESFELENISHERERHGVTHVRETASSSKWETITGPEFNTLHVVYTCCMMCEIDRRPSKAYTQSSSPSYIPSDIRQLTVPSPTGTYIISPSAVCCSTACCGAFLLRTCQSRPNAEIPLNSLLPRPNCLM